MCARKLLLKTGRKVGVLGDSREKRQKDRKSTMWVYQGTGLEFASCFSVSDTQEVCNIYTEQMNAWIILWRFLLIVLPSAKFISSIKKTQNLHFPLLFCTHLLLYLTSKLCEDWFKPLSIFSSAYSHHLVSINLPLHFKRSALTVSLPNAVFPLSHYLYTISH